MCLCAEAEMAVGQTSGGTKMMAVDAKGQSPKTPRLGQLLGGHRRPHSYWTLVPKGTLTTEGCHGERTGRKLQQCMKFGGEDFRLGRALVVTSSSVALSSA